MAVIEAKTFAIANIARVDIIEEKEEDPKKYSLLEVASKAEASAYISAGQDEELRVKNTIHAQNITEDITKGYEISLNTVKAVLEVLALVDGGKWDSESNKYTGPVAGKVTERTPFTMNVYTEDLDYNGDIKGYICFTFKHCKGSPVNFIIEDGNFMANDMKLKSRPKFGENVVEFSKVSELPTLE
ncbi:MAG: hypothetical protein ACTJGH_00425 [Peptoniphilaceae bacterium]